jgi:nucleolar protein 53
MVPFITEKISKKRKAQDGDSGPKKKIAIAPSRHAVVGAPSQQNQTSRKSKKAWRKNVDIGEVEEKLEELREEERILGCGCRTSHKTHGDLRVFTEDL